MYINYGQLQPQRGRMYREPSMWWTPPKNMLRMDERVQLTEDEVRHEQARQLSIVMGCPTRVRGAKVEILFGDVWAEHRERAS